MYVNIMIDPEKSQNNGEALQALEAGERRESLREKITRFKAGLREQLTRFTTRRQSAEAAMRAVQPEG